jgi:hypothetical protein
MERSARSCTSCASSTASRCLRRWLPRYDRSVLCRFCPVLCRFCPVLCRFCLSYASVLCRFCLSYGSVLCRFCPMSLLPYVAPLPLSCYIFASPLVGLSTYFYVFLLLLHSLAPSSPTQQASAATADFFVGAYFWRKKISYAPSAQVS